MLAHRGEDDASTLPAFLAMIITMATTASPLHAQLSHTSALFGSPYGISNEQHRFDPPFHCSCRLQSRRIGRLPLLIRDVAEATPPVFGGLCHLTHTNCRTYQQTSMP